MNDFGCLVDEIDDSPVLDGIYSEDEKNEKIACGLRRFAETSATFVITPIFHATHQGGQPE